jgi:hypothetical protein
MSAKASLLMGSSLIAAVLLLSGHSWSQASEVSKDVEKLAMLDRLVVKAKAAAPEVSFSIEDAKPDTEGGDITFAVIQSVRTMAIEEVDSIRQIKATKASAENLQHAKARLKDFLERHEELKKAVP